MSGAPKKRPAGATSKPERPEPGFVLRRRAARRAAAPPQKPVRSPPAAGRPANPAREVAAEVLLRVERDGAWAGATLQAALDGRPGLDPRDAALAGELALGTLRRQLSLDSAIEGAAGRPVAEIELPVRILLREAAYQLLHLERIPPHAAVHEAVELTRAQGLGRASGFVNAVLRRIQRGPPPALPEDPAERLAIEQSHPVWLVRRWIARLGLAEARRLCEAENLPAPLCLRANARRTTAEALAARIREARPKARVEPGRFSPLAVNVLGAGPVGKLPGLREGLFQVQDEAAQLVSLYASPGRTPLLDICAAPGGKASHLAELGARPVVALDLSPRKLGRVAAEARRLGLPLVPVAADARALPVRREAWPFVLVDAPCSGLGTLRRHPELRWRRQPEDIPRLALLQRQILAEAAHAVAPGGRLVYAVCTTEPEEGSAQLDWLLAEQPDFVLDPPPGLDAVTTGGVLSTSPALHGTDGFYAFRVRRVR